MEANLDTVCFISVTAFTFGLLILRIYVSADQNPKSNKIGPTYWGAYADAAKKEAPELIAIKLERPSNENNPLAGGSGYAKGQAVKSARAK